MSLWRIGGDISPERRRMVKATETRCIGPQPGLFYKYLPSCEILTAHAFDEIFSAILRHEKSELLKDRAGEGRCEI